METAETLVLQPRAGAATCDLAASERRAWVLDAFRVVVGGGLIAHFAAAFVELPGLVGSDGLLPGRPLYGVALDATMLRWVSGAGVALAATIALGLAPRIGAALLCLLALGLQRATFELSTLDDHLATIAALWLFFLPIGRALTVARPLVSAVLQLTVEGRTAFVCGLHFVFLQLDVSLWRTFAPAWPDSLPLNACFFGLAIALFLPVGLLRALAASAITVLHVGLWLSGNTGLVFAHVLFAACPLLFWGACAAEQRPAPWNAASAAGAWVLALTALVRMGAAVPPISLSSIRMLGDFGLLPAASSVRDEPITLALRGDGDALRTLALPELQEDARARRALAYAGATAPQLAEQSESVARGIAERVCAHAAQPGEAGALVLERGRASAEVAWLDCGRAPDPPRVVMLRAEPPK